MLHYWTAGESHGRAMVAMVDGFPAGVTIQTQAIDAELRRRQGGYGRGGRQRIETDRVEVVTGIWRGTSLGGPIALQVINKDYKLERMDDLDRPRPGHGDLSGAIKHLGSIRGVLERASAPETTLRGDHAGGLVRGRLGGGPRRRHAVARGRGGAGPPTARRVRDPTDRLRGGNGRRPGGTAAGNVGRASEAA